MLKPRHLKFLNQIMLVPNYVKLSDYSTLLGVSEKTLSRDISELNEQYLYPKIRIATKKGVGIALEATHDQYLEMIHQLSILVSKDKNSVLPLKIRRLYILAYMLIYGNRYLSQQEIADKFYVSKSVINEDLKALEQVFKDHCLIINTSRRGTLMRANEETLREMLLEVLVHLHEVENSTQHSGNNSLLLPEYFFEYFDDRLTKDEYALLDRIVHLVSEMTIATISFEEKRKLYFGLFVMIYRNKCSLDDHHKVFQEVQNQDNVIDNSPLHHVINYIYDEIDDVVELHPNEAFYLYRLLRSVTSLKSIELNYILPSVDKALIEAYTDDFTDAFSTITEINLRKERDFLNKVGLHINKMLQRLLMDNQMENNILKKIECEYKITLDICNIICRILERKYKLPRLTIDEISYLTLYIQLEIINNSTTKNVLVLMDVTKILCEMLITQLKNYFPNWCIRSISVEEYKELIFKNQKYDFLLTTLTNIPEGNTVPILHIQSILSEEEVTNIHNFDRQLNAIQQNLSLKLIQIIHDLIDIGCEVKIYRGNDLNESYGEDAWDFHGQSQIKYRYEMVDNSENLCKIRINNDKSIKAIAFQFMNWDFMLFASKLVYLLENYHRYGQLEFINWLESEV